MVLASDKLRFALHGFFLQRVLKGSLINLQDGISIKNCLLTAATFNRFNY